MNIVKESQKLKELINKASTVFLMAHKDLDLDAINSCVAMEYYLNKNGKDAYIVVDDKKFEPGVKKVLDAKRDMINFIKGNKVNTLLDEKSLLIILDTSKEKLVQNSDIIASFKQIINIDHHDETPESIHVTLKIIDNNVSSTCEMLTQLFREENVKIPTSLATLLLGGIILDTNYYCLKVTAETFYNSYYLVKCGGEVSEVNELLRQNIDDYIKRQKIIASVKVINRVAIGKGLQRSEYKKEEIAKTADSLLTFNNIEASFVVARIDKELVGVSARSVGKINVGKILETFGGGGSDTDGAAKIENTNVQKVFDDLSKIIRSR